MSGLVIKIGPIVASKLEFDLDYSIPWYRLCNFVGTCGLDILFPVMQAPHLLEVHSCADSRCDIPHFQQAFLSLQNGPNPVFTHYLTVVLVLACT